MYVTRSLGVLHLGLPRCEIDSRMIHCVVKEKTSFHVEPGHSVANG